MAQYRRDRSVGDGSQKRLLTHRQCLNRRISKADIDAEVSAWEIARNKLQGKVNGQFTTRDARVKLRRLYPELQQEGAANV